MTSLARCLDQAGAEVSSTEARVLKKIARSYRADGFTAQEADANVLRDVIDDLEKDLTSILKQAGATAEPPKPVAAAPEPVVKVAEKLVGGVADKVPDAAIPPKALEKGIAEEKEHTKDPETKKEIAKDHLVQDPQYYSKLEKIEKPAGMKYAQLLKQAMPIPQGSSWSPQTNSLSLAKPIGVKQAPGSLALKPGESVGEPAAAAPAAPSVTPAPVTPPPMPVTNAPPPPITDTPITAGFQSTPAPKAAAAAPVTPATPPPLPMPPAAQPMPVPIAPPKVPVSPPEHPQAQHPSSTVRSASMKNATILERSALLMCVVKEAQSLSRNDRLFLSGGIGGSAMNNVMTAGGAGAGALVGGGIGALTDAKHRKRNALIGSLLGALAGGAGGGLGTTVGLVKTLEAA